MAPNQNKKRVNFASIKNPLQFPDFLEVQLKSFQDFFQLDTPPERRKKEGLYKVFAENFPIADTRNNFVLEFLDYYVDPPKYSIEECLSRGLTYSVPLKAKLKLYCTDPDHEDFATVIQDVFLGPMVPSVLSYLSCTVLLGCSLGQACIRAVHSCIQLVLSHSVALG